MKRSKGRRGEIIARHILEDNGYTVKDISQGISTCDLLAHKDGETLSVEVKNRNELAPIAFRTQARDNAKAGTRWAWMARIAGTQCWILEIKGRDPIIYKEHWHD
jgi:Holliday junction resolvase-like predicted endonuclease